MNILPKDFIETHEGLIFAVVEKQLDSGRVLSFLRYIPNRDGAKAKYQKISTYEANFFLKENYPRYLYYSSKIDAHMHGISLNDIKHIHKPKEKLDAIVNAQTKDSIELKLQKLIRLFQYEGVDTNKLGITGSLLIGAQHSDSDIDLVIYERETFNRLRNLVVTLIEKSSLEPLDERHWHESYLRRDCELSFSDYVWHEVRKANKALIQGTKFDLSLVEEALPDDEESWHKSSELKIRAKITDDRFSYDYPARYSIDHAEIKQILAFTHTYVGQAMTGEKIEAFGKVEISQAGFKRMIIGSTREAKGEYLKVVE